VSLDGLRKDGVAEPEMAKLAKIQDVFYFSKQGFLERAAKILYGDKDVKDLSATEQKDLKAFEDKFIKYAVKVELLETGKSEKPRDKYEIHLDPGLKRLTPEKLLPGDTSFAENFFPKAQDL